MRYILVDEISGRIMSLSENKDNGMYSLSEEAYAKILQNNGYAHINLQIMSERIKTLESMNDEESSVYAVIDDSCVLIGWEETIFSARKKKMHKANNECNNIIEAGIRHCGKRYTYKLEDQINMSQLWSLVEAGLLTNDTKIPVKAMEEEVADLLTVDEFNGLYFALLKHKFHNINYLSQFKLYVESLEDINEVSRADYGMILPDLYNEKLQSLMAGFNKEVAK